MKRTIADLPSSEITHEHIFKLWFKVKVDGTTYKEYKKGKSNIYFLWTRVMGYNSDTKYYHFTIEARMTRDELLKLEYAMLPKE